MMHSVGAPESKEVVSEAEMRLRPITSYFRHQGAKIWFGVPDGFPYPAASIPHDIGSLLDCAPKLHFEQRLRVDVAKATCYLQDSAWHQTRMDTRRR
jgi:hypothetical protein